MQVLNLNLNAPVILLLISIVAAAAIIIIIAAKAQSRKKQTSRHKTERMHDSRTQTAETDTKPGKAPGGKEAREQDASGKRDLAIAKMIEAKAESDRVLRNMPYVKLFERLAKPIQILIGMSRGAGSWGNEIVKSYYEDYIRSEMSHTLRTAKANLEGGKLSIPEAMVDEDDETLISEAASWTMEEIQSREKRHRSEAQSGGNCLIMRNICIEMGEILTEITRTQDIDKQLMQKIAARTDEILKGNGVFPLFADDPGLASQPELIGRFVPISGDLKLPGLFVEERGKLNVLGHFGGTR